MQYFQKTKEEQDRRLSKCVTSSKDEILFHETLISESVCVEGLLVMMCKYPFVRISVVVKIFRSH